MRFITQLLVSKHIIQYFCLIIGVQYLGRERIELPLLYANADK